MYVINSGVKLADFLPSDGGRHVRGEQRAAYLSTVTIFTLLCCVCVVSVCLGILITFSF